MYNISFRSFLIPNVSALDISSENAITYPVRDDYGYEFIGEKVR